MIKLFMKVRVKVEGDCGHMWNIECSKELNKCNKEEIITYFKKSEDENFKIINIEILEGPQKGIIFEADIEKRLKIDFEYYRNVVKNLPDFQIKELRQEFNDLINEAENALGGTNE